MEHKISIENNRGDVVEATAPVVISASRSTDIPAFYGKWLINRLKKGYCVWVNPFNRSKPYYVSFKNTRVIVFWTKNPEPLFPYLPELDRLGIHYYFQFTLNDYEQEHYEPKLPGLETRIATFRKLSQQIGKERVIWRFDPIIIVPDADVRHILRKIWRIGNALKGYTDKLVFSFVDIAKYTKVRKNMIGSGLFSEEQLLAAQPSDALVEELVEGIAKLRDYWKSEGWDLELATCAESVDLESYGISHNKCIDDDLMKKLFKEDLPLVHYLNTGRLGGEYGNLFDSEEPVVKKSVKDKGQRSICGCFQSKDIGMYDTCSHDCVYCYANASRELVLRNRRQHNDTAESIVPFSMG